MAGADGGNCNAAGHERVKDTFESERGAYGGGDLGGEVGRDLNPREVADGG